MLVIFSTYLIGHQHLKLHNISNFTSPTHLLSKIRHQHQCNPFNQSISVDKKILKIIEKKNDFYLSLADWLVRPTLISTFTSTNRCLLRSNSRRTYHVYIITFLDEIVFTFCLHPFSSTIAKIRCKSLTELSRMKLEADSIGRY